MTAPILFFSPGSLVRARGREWIVLPGAAENVLRLRPLSGAEGDVQVLDPALEPDEVVPASFSAPSPEHFGTQAEALLLRDALLLSLRRGAGPFRSAEDVLDYCAEVTVSRCGADAALSAREIAVIKCVMKMSADRIFSPSG